MTIRSVDDKAFIANLSAIEVQQIFFMEELGLTN